jgi:hypothetical protein
MIDVEGKISNQPISILIDLVEIFYLKRSKHERSWLVQLDFGTKKKTNEIVKDFPLDMDGVNNIADLKIILLGSYDVLIGME